MWLIDGYLPGRSDAPAPPETTPERLRELYAYPDPLDRPWIRTNFVSSIDGAISTDGVSGGLGTPADHAVFAVLRELADVIVVGAGTVRAEDYGGVKLDEGARTRRQRAGLTPVPPIVVVTASARLDPKSRLFTDTDVAPIVCTSESAPRDRRDAIAAAGARVEVVDTDTVTVADLLDLLTRLGYRRVLCEGGPSLFGDLLAAGALDELCLTTSPVLVAGDAHRLATSPTAHPTPMVPGHILLDTDGTVLTRWVRAS